MTRGLVRGGKLFLVLAAVALVLTAAGLSQLQLQAGIPLPGNQSEGSVSPGSLQPIASISVSTFLKAVLGVIFSLLLLYSLYRAVRGLNWRETLQVGVRIAVFTGLFLALLFALTRVQVNFTVSDKEVLPPALPVEGPPLGQPPAGLIWLVWAALGLLAAWIAFRVITRLTRPPVEDLLQREAERAVHALSSGEDLRSVVLRCYQQMSLILKREQGIERDAAVTAREFEGILGAKGFPTEPINQLTRLFETARYSVRPPEPGEEQAAVASLTAIIIHVQDRKRPG